MSLKSHYEVGEDEVQRGYVPSKGHTASKKIVDLNPDTLLSDR